MQRVIITDTSCIIQLDLVGELELLNKIYSNVTVTPEIAGEYDKPLPSWFEIVEPQNRKYQQILENSLDRGEASAIALAVEEEDALLIIDDLKGRKLAGELRINIIGTLGIIADAKLQGHLASVKKCIEDFKRTVFRISDELEEAILRKAGEL
jgi:predicted nucleic acid-binding protein